MNKMVIFLSSLGTGGAERVAINYANYVANNSNNKVYIVIFNGMNNNIYNIDNKVNVVVLDSIKGNRIKKILHRISNLKQILNEIDPDIIFTMFATDTLYSLFCKNKKSKIISSERANIKFRTFFKRFLYKFTSKKCNGFIFQTNKAKEDYPKKTQKRSIVIPNPVYVTLNNKNTKKEDVITAMGRLTYQKGFDILIKAFSTISKEYPNYKLSIFGNGPDLEQLKKLSSDLDISDKVLFNGIRKDALEEIAKSKIFVLSSRFEGMPNALMEAMAVGTACISTNCDYGPDELIDNNVNGLLVNVDDIDELIMKIKYLIENDDIRKKIEQNSKNILVTNDPKIIYKKYYDYMINTIIVRSC